MKLKYIYITIALFVVSFGMYGQTYNQITLTSELTNGDYLIVADGATNDGIMLNTITAATPFINKTDVTNPGTSITSGFTSANVFTIDVSGGNITIYNSNLGYVSWGRTGNTGNTATFFNGTVATTEQWTPTVASGLWTLANVGTPARSLQWNNSNPRFAAYTSAQVRLKLYKLAASTPDIALANNGTQIAASNVNQGTTNHVLHKFSLAVTTANATLSGITVTTAGTYVAADITNLKVRYSTDATLDAGDATLSTATSPGIAGSKTFPSFTSQVINSGSTGYIFITADIAGTAGAGSTIGVNAVTTAQLSFSSGNKSGSTTAAGAQTFTVATPVIAIADNGTAIAVANVNQGASNHILATFKADVTTANATLTDANIYFDGTYTGSDIVASGLKLWYNTTNSFGTATTLQSKTAAAAGAGEIISFTGLSQSVAIGTRYFWVTANLSPTATAGRTIRALSVANTDLLFSSGTKSGSATISGTQTIVTATPAITLADNGTQVTAANVNLSTLNHVLHKFSLAVTTNSATLTGIQVTTAGTYITADLTNLKVRYSANATLDAGDATLSTYTSVPTAGTLTFPSFASQLISSGTTGYIFITADIAAGAVAGNTIGVNAVTTSQLTFSTGTKSGTTNAGGLQTVAAPTVVIWTNPIDGTNPNTSNPYTTGDTVVSNISVSGIGRGSGINGANATNRYSASNWSTSALDTNDYFEFMLTPNAGYKINLTSFIYSGESSGTGPISAAIRSSVDGFVADIGSATISGTTISLSAGTYQNITSAITFRLYGWGGSNSAGTFSTNSFTFNGSVSSAGPIIIPTATSVSGFSYVAGSGPASSQTLNISAANLTGFPSNLTIIGSTNYEVSTDNSSFGASRTVAYTSATLAATPIYVRLKAGLIAGTYNGETISISGGGATTVNVTCDGSVFQPFYKSRASGSWATASNWESSADNSIFTTATVAPSNAVTAITILNNHNISISSGTVTADDITVATGGTLTISGGTFILNNGAATTDLQVNGTLTYSSGTFTQGSAGVAFSANATYNHAVVSTAIPIATWDVASNCVVTVIPPSTFNNIGQSYGNFTWNCTSQSTFFNINSNAFQVRGLFRLLSTGATQNISMAGTTAGTYANTINAASIEGGIFAIAFSASVISTTTITNDFSVSGGEVRINGANGTGTLNIGRDLLMSGTGYLNPLFLSTSLSTTITIARDLTMSGNSRIDFESIDIVAASTIINVGRNFTSTSVGDATDFVAVDFGGSSPAGTVAGNALNIAGNFSCTGTGQIQTFSENAPTGIVFNGSGVQTFTYTTAITFDWVPITINTGTTLQLQNSFSIGESTDSPVTTITVNGALDFQNHAITAFTSTVPRFNTSAGATLITANTAGLGGTGTTGSLRGFGSVAATAPANGKIVFLAGTNYTFNGATTTPFPTAFGNPATINVNAAVTSNMTSGLTITSAFNVNNGGTFALNPTTNNLTLNNASFTINTGGTFDNGGENQINNGGGTPTINISGTFITKDVQGFVGDNTAIPGITPTLNSGSTVEYGFAGNQAVQGGRSYNNMTISNGGTKTLSSAITNTNTITGTVTIKDASILNVGSLTFGGSGTNLTMTGTSEYITSGTGSKPDAEGTYNLTGGVVRFANNSATPQTIKNKSYQNIEVTGSNVGNSNGNITLNSGGTFTVKTGGIFSINDNAIVGPIGTQTVTVENGAVFKTGDPDGFNGSSTATSIRSDIENISLAVGSRIEFAGNQVLPATQTITPFSGYSDVGISGTGTKTLANTTEVYVGRDLLLFPETVSANTGFLQIDANRLLTVERNILNTSTKDLIVKDSGNLVQVTNVDNATTNANTGNIKMTRTSRVMYENDYIYWGSPVKEDVISQIPSSFDSTYQWDLTGAIDGAWNALSAIVPGRGFITKVASGVTTAKDFDFTGTPNNGTVNVTANAFDADFNLDTSGNTILLANPYPCALDATNFFDANTLILDGTFYFWTSSTANSGAAYIFNDYATWNKLGGTSTAPPASNSDSSLKPEGKIAAGQGFFADIHDDGIISFTNAMRERTTSGNSQFFKTTNVTKTTAEKHRIWLNLTNKKNAFRQMLVGYITDATNGFDRSFDGEAFTGNEINIYSVLEDKNLVIQGRALPFKDADSVPLGIFITNVGEYTIAVDEVDGVFMKGQDIYLEDKLLNVIANLKNPYTFNAVSGTFNDRFVLRYTAKTLGTTDFEKLENQVLVSNKNKQIKVNSKVESIDKVSVYDLLGRQLFKKDKVNSTELTIPNLLSNQQTLLVKVTLQNGQTVTKKIIY